MVDEAPEVVRVADEACEVIRVLNHLSSSETYPAPVVYGVLGNLKFVGHGLHQTCTQLVRSLGRSLDEYEVYEEGGRDPLQSAATATDHLTRAAQLATGLGEELEKAQNAISRQGYREDTDGGQE